MTTGLVSRSHVSESALTTVSVQLASSQPVSVVCALKPGLEDLGHCSPARPPWPSLLRHGKPGGPYFHGSGHRDSSRSLACLCASQLRPSDTASQGDQATVALAEDGQEAQPVGSLAQGRAGDGE